MGSYMQQYGVSELRRNRVITWIVVGAVSIVVLSWIAYLVFHDYSEKQAVKQFLAQVNAHDYQNAYRDWGCSTEHPCPNYDYKRFMEDWGPSKKVTSPWQIASVDGCRDFVTVNVQAAGAELQSLAVQRGTTTMGYAPSPECQEAKWHWKQFFQRIMGKSSS